MFLYFNGVILNYIKLVLKTARDNNMFILKNTIQNYQWGKSEWISDFLNIKKTNNSPQAELWMGAHPKSPSKTIKGQSLNSLIDKKGSELLGENTYEKYGRLPFLFKILAVDAPLSIQVHPSKSQAEEGFKNENEKSIPLDAHNRNYRDNNHKPEIICAVEPFTAMKGFRSLNIIIEKFSPISKSIKENLFSGGDHASFFFTLMGLSENEKKQILTEARKIDSKSLEWMWVKKLMNFYPDDISALSPLFLNLVELKKGEALFLPAGELHAYLSGVGIELMANSDNVLRGGLTPKHMDLEELKKIVNFKHSYVEILKKGFHDLYPSRVEEFLLGQKKIIQSYELSLNTSSAILLAFSGTITVTRGKENHHLKKGETLFIDSKKENPTLQGTGEVFWARTGVNP